MNIIKQQSPNFGSRCGWRPDMIVFHITEGAFDGACAWLCNKASGISAHFVVGRDGRIAQLVDLKNAAYCNGTQSGSPGGYEYVGRATAALVKSRRVNANLYTVSIECEGWTKSTHGILTDAQFAALVELVGYIRQQVKATYGTDIPCDRTHLIGHNEIAPREKPDCPGRDFPRTKLINVLNPLPARGCIDAPAATGELSGAFEVKGWGIAQPGISRFDIYADGKLGLASIGSLDSRPDVARVYPGYPDAVLCGYHATIPAGKLACGRHSIDVAAIAKDSSVHWTSRIFDIK